MPRGLRIAIRADASAQIGHGHIMRCATLADHLAGLGHTCHFITRARDPGTKEMLAKLDHPVHLLSEMPDSAPPGGVYGRWLGVSGQDDAAATGAILDRIASHMLVVDHYALDAKWERALADRGPIMVIDDLANRDHDCALLLDQNLGRRSADYGSRVGRSTEVLAGTKWALLRPQFRNVRFDSLSRRASIDVPRDILLMMGGADGANANTCVLRALAAHTPPFPLSVTVALSSKAPHLAKVRHTAAQMDIPVSVRTDVSDMAGLMSQSDLAIGASGGSAWERCCLGLPTLVYAVEANQEPGARALVAAGAAARLNSLDADCVSDGLRRFAEDHSALSRMSQAAAALCDGAGVHRVGAKIEALFLAPRPAKRDDCKSVFDWRADPNANRFFEKQETPSWPDHVNWFDRAIADPDRELWMVDLIDRPVAHIRFDHAQDGTAVVGIVLAPEMRGRGLSTACLGATIDLAQRQRPAPLIARVHQDNAASRRLFSACGFRKTVKSGGFVTFKRDAGHDTTKADGYTAR